MIPKAEFLENYFQRTQFLRGKIIIKSHLSIEFSKSGWNCSSYPTLPLLKRFQHTTLFDTIFTYTSLNKASSTTPYLNRYLYWWTCYRQEEGVVDQWDELLNKRKSPDEKLQRWRNVADSQIDIDLGVCRRNGYLKGLERKWGLLPNNLLNSLDSSLFFLCH